MRYLKVYKIFESDNPTKDYFNDKINWDLIDSLKDMSYDYLDEGCKLLYSIMIDTTDPYRDLVIGSFYTREEISSPDVHVGDFEMELWKKQQKAISKDSMHFINLYGNNLTKAIASWEKSQKMTYGIGLYKSGYYGQQRERDDDGQMDLLYRIKEMYPDENIYIH